MAVWMFVRAKAWSREGSSSLGLTRSANCPLVNKGALQALCAPPGSPSSVGGGEVGASHAVTPPHYGTGELAFE